MSYFIVLTLYLPNTELISIFLLNNELRDPPIQALISLMTYIIFAIDAAKLSSIN